MVYNITFPASAVVGAVADGAGFSLHPWVSIRSRAPLLIDQQMSVVTDAGFITILSVSVYLSTFPQSKLHNNKLKSDEVGNTLGLAPSS